MCKIIKTEFACCGKVGAYARQDGQGITVPPAGRQDVSIGGLTLDKRCQHRMKYSDRCPGGMARYSPLRTFFIGVNIFSRVVARQSTGANLTVDEVND